MRRLLNFTGRIRIRQSDIKIRLRSEDEQPLTFVAERSIDSYNLPSDAKVYLEAYRGPSYMRFDWGTVVYPVSPGSGSALTDIDSNDTVNFRVKVVDATTTDGMILAQADRIRANVSEQSLLPVESKDLDDVVWDLSFDDDEPFLLVNSRVDGILDRVSSDPDFAALVFPTVLRDILERLCNETDGDDEQPAWVAGWKRFALDLTRQPVPSADDIEKDEWVEATVNAFSKKHRLLSRYQESLNVRS